MFLAKVASYLLLIVSTLVNSIIPLLASNVLTENFHFDDWSANDAYSLEEYEILEKNPDEDFKVLLISDLQQMSAETIFGASFAAEAMIDELVSQADPDLIVALGDNACGMFAYEWFISYLESLNIPWAAVMGNHDWELIPNEGWAAYKMMKAENCLFSFGPADMGYGNYPIHISQNGEIIHSLYLMDTHSSIYSLDGLKLVDEYDGLWNKQLEWYKWNVSGINSLAGKTVESTLLMHIPLPEYVDAYAQIESDETAFGEKGEEICCSSNNKGMFNLMKELGSTKNVVCGHDHKNNFSTNYQGIRLSYVTKTGECSSYVKERLGGSLLTINQSGNATLSHIIVNPDELVY